MTTPQTRGFGQDFQNGYILHFPDAGEILFAIIRISHRGDFWMRWREGWNGSPVTFPVRPDEGTFLPWGQIGAMWSYRNLWQCLGFALTESPIEFGGYCARFRGGWLVTNHTGDAACLIERRGHVPRHVILVGSVNDAEWVTPWGIVRPGG